MCKLALLAQTTFAQVLIMTAEHRFIAIVETLVAAGRRSAYVGRHLTRDIHGIAHHHNWGRRLRHYIHRRVKPVLAILRVLLIYLETRIVYFGVLLLRLLLLIRLLLT